MWKYLRFGYIHWIWMAITITGLLMGGWWMWAGVVFLFVVGVGGEMVTSHWRDETNPDYRFPIIHDLIIYSAVIGHVLTTLVAAWVGADGDPLGFGQWIGGFFAPYSVDVMAAKSANVWYDYLGAGLSLGGVLGVSGISAAHELTHRTANPLDMWFGRWDFALSFGGNFATEHVFGHHKKLGYPDLDPVSPKRGDSFYRFLTLGTWQQWSNGLGIEKRRLEGKGKRWLSIENRILHAWARGAAVVATVVAIGGTTALAVWLVAAAFSKYILEGLNFFSHYGIVRLPGEKITIRNTFSSCNPLSNHFTFNLGRHGSHHEHDTPYYEFQYKAMPECPYGYLTMTLFSWIPPVFWHYMVPMLRDWDDNWATPEERAVVDAHSEQSGVPALTAMHASPG